MGRVVLENLVKEYPEKKGVLIPAVNGINLTVEEGEFMVLVGPSGCGKSTTLRMIAGLEEVSSGTVTIDGRVVNDVPPKDRDIAMVFQNYALYPHMTVYENMAFGLKLRKMSKAAIDARVREAAGLLGLDDYLDRKPKALSGGQRQRVAVGRAIVRKPKVFLFDEPLSNLDAQMRAATRAEISRLHNRLGATMIYVTHDQVEAMTMGDRICVMKDGHVMQVAEPLELYHRPDNLFVAGFIGSPPMNAIRGAIRRGAGGRLYFVADERIAQGSTAGGIGGESSKGVCIQLDGPFAESVAAHTDAPVVLGIRPEDVHEVSEPGWEAVGATLEARLELAEPMGAETHLHATAGGHPLVARVRSSVRPEIGATLRLGLDLTRAHLFDPESQRHLTSFLPNGLGNGVAPGRGSV